MEGEFKHDHERETAAKELLAATRLTEGEIEKIASAPHLFGSIRTRIAENRLEKEVVRPSRFGWLGVKALSAAAVLVTVVGAAAFVLLKSDGKQMQAVNPPALIPTVTQSKQFENASAKPAATINRSSTPDREVARPLPQQISENAIVKEYIRRQPARKGKRDAAPRTEEQDFYALNASAWETRDGRIVRVTLPRASLVALGANISLEGDSQNVTADLLVGADGVPRAIRVVDQ
jgi:hypothetical protein